MTGSLTEPDRVVLLGVLADSLAFDQELQANPGQYRSDLDPVKDYERGFGVRINHVRWAGLLESDPTITKRLQRAILKLTRLQLLERIAASLFGDSDPPRITPVKLTDAGRKLAVELVQDTTEQTHETAIPTIH